MYAMILSLQVKHLTCSLRLAFHAHQARDPELKVGQLRPSTNLHLATLRLTLYHTCRNILFDASTPPHWCHWPSSPVSVFENDLEVPWLQLYDSSNHGICTRLEVQLLSDRNPYILLACFISKQRPPIEDKAMGRRLP